MSRPDAGIRHGATAPAAVSANGRSDRSKHAIIWLFVLIELFPLYMMLQVSFKDNAGFLHNPWLPTAPSAWHWENWSHAFRLILPYVANTMLVAASGTVASLALAVLAAYFFARYRMPFSGVLWSAFIMLMLLPGVANIVPLFMLLKSFSLLNTLWALIIVGVAGAQVFNIFVLRNFIEELPKDLFEAAEIDGASHWQQIVNIVLPLSGSILGTLGVLAFLAKWNEFLLPLIVLRDKELYTLGVGLIYLDGEYVKQWGQIMAAYVIASLPLMVIFLFCMRLFVRGLSQGAIKG
jgi:multiple sugar transport system permease protein